MRLKALLAALLSLFAVSTYAQFGASIQGTVVDKSGGVVAGATVTVTNQDTGAIKTSVTGDTGFYRASALVPGNHTITVEAGGFNKEVPNNLFLRTQQLTAHAI